MSHYSNTVKYEIPEGAFAACLILAISDPLNLNPDGINGESLTAALYFIPVFGFIIYKVFKK